MAKHLCPEINPLHFQILISLRPQTSRMEKITKETIEEFIRNNSIELKPCQPSLCIPIIDRIYRKMSHDIKFPDILVDGDVIADGHHRYLASLMAGYVIEQQPGTRSPANDVRVWKSVVFEENEWDTQAKIDHLNRQDADFNGIQLAVLVELVK